MTGQRLSLCFSTMNPVFLLLPAIATMVWAMVVKARQQKGMDVLILMATMLAVVVNMLLVYRMMTAELSVGLHLVQMTACSCILPLLYTYFARQVGRLTPNSAALLLMWGGALLTFVPNILIYDPWQPLVVPAGGLHPYVLYVLSGGETQFAICTGDLVTVLQAIIILVRILSFMRLLHHHRLHLSRTVYAFGVCWLLPILFTFMISGMTYEELRTPAVSWFYFGFYAILTVMINTLIALGYDRYPVESEEGELVPDVDVYVRQKHTEMADRMRHIMEDEQLYLDPQLSVERIVRMLNTNHTYFSQMMSSIWGISFSEYLNDLRLKHVEQLLADPDISISAAAVQSGFADAGYMSRRFKVRNGMTPTEWRKQR